MNETIKTQLNHRTIRAFKNQELTDEQKKTLEEVARHTSTSMFLQQFSMMHVTDEEKRAKIREITGQKYVGANGDLFIFVADLYRNSEIRRQLGKDEGALHGPMFSCRQLKIRFWPCKISSMRLKAWDLAPLF